MSFLSRLLSATVLGAALGSGSAIAAETEIGEVMQQEFLGAEGLRESGARESLYFNTDVFSSETVETGRGGRTALRFLDGTQLQVGGNSSVVLDRFIYDPDTEVGDAAITFTKGLFRFTSGDMRNKDAAMVLKTPTATLSIRGTKFLLWVAPKDGATELLVEEGSVFVIPCGGNAVFARRSEIIQVPADCSGASRASERSNPPGGLDDAGPGGDDSPDGGFGDSEPGDGNLDGGDQGTSDGQTDGSGNDI